MRFSQHGNLLSILLAACVCKYTYGIVETFTRQPKIYDLYHPFELNCTLNIDVYVPKYIWHINETLVTADNKGVELMNDDDAVLRVLHAGVDDFGNYTCYVGEVVASAWQAEARPHAHLQGNNIDITLGQDFEISCKLIGKPYGAVTWLYTSENGSIEHVNVNSNRLSVRDSVEGVPGGVLIGRDGQVSDAGLYTCVPPRYGPSASMMLRIMESHRSYWFGFGIGILTMTIIVIIAIAIAYFAIKRMAKYKGISGD